MNKLVLILAIATIMMGAAAANDPAVNTCSTCSTDPNGQGLLDNGQGLLDNGQGLLDNGMHDKDKKEPKCDKDRDKCKHHEPCKIKCHHKEPRKHLVTEEEPVIMVTMKATL